MSSPEIREAGVDAPLTTLKRDLSYLVSNGEIESRGINKNTTYRIRLDDNGNPAEPFDLFTAGG
jgi:hypothetical protein